MGNRRQGVGAAGGAGSRGGRSRRHFVAAAGAGALATGAAFVPKRVFAQKKVTVRYTLGWLPEGANIWSYAAKQFWTNAGIDVVIEKGTSSPRRPRRSPRASTNSSSPPRPLPSSRPATA